MNSRSFSRGHVLRPFVIVLAICYFSCCINAFVIHATDRRRAEASWTSPGENFGAQRIRRSECYSRRRRPPTSDIDLDEILEFEKSLDSEDDSTNGGVEESNDNQSFAKTYDSNDDVTNDWIYFAVSDDLHETRIDRALETLLNRWLDGDLANDSTSFSSNESLDEFAIKSPSRSQVVALVEAGEVFLRSGESQTSSTINEKSAKVPKLDPVKRKSYKVLEGETICITLSALQRHCNDIGGMPTEIVPEKIPLDILYEDEHMIVINKVAGMVVHPAAGNWNGTLVNALAYYLLNESPIGPGEFAGLKASSSSTLSQTTVIEDEPLDNVNGEFSSATTLFVRPGIVHRLDKGTTGVIVVAKTSEALAKLSAAFKSRKVQKTYVAITVGNPGNDVVIDNYIARHPLHRQRMRVVPLSGTGNAINTNPYARSSMSPNVVGSVGKRAISRVNCLAFDGKLSLAEVQIQTGRTHQIRVHLQDRGTPIYGDDVYGISDWNRKLSKQQGITRPFLHAHRLRLHHPITNEAMTFLAPMSHDMCLMTDKIWPTGRDERSDLFQ